MTHINIHEVNNIEIESNDRMITANGKKFFVTTITVKHDGDYNGKTEFFLFSDRSIDIENKKKAE